MSRSPGFDRWHFKREDGTVPASYASDAYFRRWFWDGPGNRFSEVVFRLAVFVSFP